LRRETVKFTDPQTFAGRPLNFIMTYAKQCTGPMHGHSNRSISWRPLRPNSFFVCCYFMAIEERIFLAHAAEVIDLTLHRGPVNTLLYVVRRAYLHAKSNCCYDECYDFHRGMCCGFAAVATRCPTCISFSTHARCYCLLADTSQRVTPGRWTSPNERTPPPGRRALVSGGGASCKTLNARRPHHRHDAVSVRDRRDRRKVVRHHACGCAAAD